VRIILFAGKGGVGKTTIAAASAVEAARRGHRTLLLSVDIAHSLADVFDLERGLLDLSAGAPVQVAGRLWIQEIDVHEEIRRYWGEIYSYVAAVLRTTGLGAIVAEELAILPGMDELVGLFYVNQYHRDRAYDLLIIDCAPTGESLRVIAMPTALEWYMKKLFKLERNVARLVRPVVRPLSPIPVPEEHHFAAVDRMFQKLEGVDLLIHDPEITTARLVTMPEKMVLKETQRAAPYFNLYGVHVDAIIMNRILPAGSLDPRFDAWRGVQQRYIELGHEYFAPLPILEVPLSEREILGLAGLETLGSIYGERDPAEILYREEPFRFVAADGRYRIHLRLPFARREEIDLFAVGDELVIKLGAIKRSIALPRSLAGRRPAAARQEGGELIVEFESHVQDDR
jgi:arsenite-transporting ATPase